MKRTLVGLAVVAAAITVVAIANAWGHPLSLHPAKPRTSSAVAALALFFVVAGIGLLAVILINARHGSTNDWRVTDPRDQGSAVAGYLASYLVPLLSPNAHGTRIIGAYAIYLLTLYVIFVRSEGLVTINPMIYVFGYRIFDVQLAPETDVGNQRRVLLLATGQLKRTMDVKAVSLGDDCYVVVEREAA